MKKSYVANLICDTCEKYFNRRIYRAESKKYYCSQHCWRISEQCSANMKGANNPMYQRNNYGVNNFNFGNKWSDDLKESASKLAKDRYVKNPELKLLCGANKGRKFFDEHIQRIFEGNTDKKLKFFSTVKKENSYYFVAKEMGMSRQFITKAIKYYNLDISHFKKGRGRKYTSEELLVNTKTKRQNAVVKNFILTHKLLPYICSGCESEPIWRGKILILQLEHKDGNPLNDLIDNLTFLCPNCHSQTVTYVGGNIKSKKGEI